MVSRQKFYGAEPGNECDLPCGEKAELYSDAASRSCLCTSVRASDCGNSGAGRVWSFDSWAVCRLFSVSGDFYPDYSVLPHGGDAGAVHLFLCAFVYGASQPARRFCGTVPGSDFCGIGMVSVFLWLFHLYSVQPCIQYVWQSDNTGAPHVLAVRGHVYCADRNGSKPLAGRAGDRTSLVEGWKKGLDFRPFCVIVKNDMKMHGRCQ